MCRQAICRRCEESFDIHSRRGPASKCCAECKRVVACESARSRKLARNSARYEKKCHWCDAHWLAKHPKSRFCSTRCQHLAGGRRVVLACKACGEEFECKAMEMRAGRQFCSRKCMLSVRRRRPRACIECGTQFIATVKKDPTKGRGLYCSKACAGAARRAGKRTGRWSEAQELRQCRAAVKPSQRMYAAIQRAMAKQLNSIASLWAAINDWRPCKHCGGPIGEHAKQNKEFCSMRCASLCETLKKCTDCDALFVTVGAQARRCLYCPLCAARRHRAYRRRIKKLLGNYRRRCRHYGVPYDQEVTRPLVFRRDSYRCGLCGRKCLRRFTWRAGKPDPRSPTIDHIVALAFKVKGHTWDNVQCACFRCNSLKGKSQKGQIRIAFS